MSYSKFSAFNITGGILWVCSLTSLGFVVGEHPWVKANFSIVALAMIIIPGLPAAWVFAKAIYQKYSKKTN
jgi:membrane-associated protein